MSSLEPTVTTGSALMHSTPRTTRKHDPLTSSMDFTPAKDFSTRTSSFKRLSASTSRRIRPDQISSSLSKSRTEPFDFKIFVDVPLQFENTHSNTRGRSPGTPKRSRADLLEETSLCEEISPIASARMSENSPDFEPRTTPKRRRSSGMMRGSLNDLFGSHREDMDMVADTGLSKSVDFSKMPSMKESVRSPRRTTSSSRDFTPPRTRSQTRLGIPPRAPRKASRSSMARSLPNLDEMPKPRRLTFSDSPTASSTPSADGSAAAAGTVDLTGVMGIVGFISSHLARTGERRVPLSSLVQLICSLSNIHRSPSSALTVVRNLAKAVPDWVSVSKEGPAEIFAFASEMTTFDVLARLRDLKRACN